MYRDDSIPVDLTGTALGVFNDEVEQGSKLPVAFRISDGTTAGLAAQGIPLYGYAVQLAYSPKRRERAAAAVMAIDFAAATIEAQEQGRIKALT